MGTVNILEALKSLTNPCNAVIITSDKCYDNVEWLWGYRENDRLGGPDPYSASKGAAEIAIRSYWLSFFNSTESNIRVASARAGNVIGGGDWAKKSNYSRRFHLLGCRQISCSEKPSCYSSMAACLGALRGISYPWGQIK